MSSDKGNFIQTNSVSGASRRAIVKGAAWSVPVVAAAVAAPLASASINNASLSVSASETSLVKLRLLDGSGLLQAQVLTTVPTQLTLKNGTGALSGTAKFTITVNRPSGINIPVGRARGFGVASLNSVDSLSSERTAKYQSLPISGIKYGFPITTFTSNRTVSVASNGSLQIPIEFGLAGDSTGVTISALTTFGVTITMELNGKTLSTTGTISVPVNAGIL